MNRVENYFTDENHPNVNDTPNGTAIYRSSDEIHEYVHVLVWQGYSASDGEYNATLAKFFIENNKPVLSWVSIKRKYSSWDDFLTTPSRFVTDLMKRRLNHFMKINL